MTGRRGGRAVGIVLTGSTQNSARSVRINVGVVLKPPDTARAEVACATTLHMADQLPDELRLHARGGGRFSNAVRTWLVQTDASSAPIETPLGEIIVAQRNLTNPDRSGCSACEGTVLRAAARSSPTTIANRPTGA